MKCYTEEVVRLPDAKLRLNLDVLLRYFAVNAPDEVKKADGDIRPAMCGYCG